MEGIIFTWFKRAAAALIAIPATALFVHLAFIIGFSSFGPGAQPLPMPWIVPGFINGVLQWTILGPAVGIGLFFFATKVPDIVDEMFQIRPAPRGGIGPGAIVAGPAGLMMGAGRAMRSTEGLGRMASSYASYGTGLKQRLGQAALSLPFVGDPDTRANVVRNLKNRREAEEESKSSGQQRGQQQTRGSTWEQARGQANEAQQTEQARGGFGWEAQEKVRQAEQKRKAARAQQRAPRRTQNRP